jgi:hypothetical protein
MRKKESLHLSFGISAEILDLYYDGVNNIYPLPKAISFDKEFIPEQWNINNQNINEIRNRLLKYSNFYIIIVDDKYIPGFNESKEKLTTFLKLNFKLIDEKSFKSEIKLYEFTNKYELQN